MTSPRKLGSTSRATESLKPVRPRKPGTAGVSHRGAITRWVCVCGCGCGCGVKCGVECGCGCGCGCGRRMCIAVGDSKGQVGGGGVSKMNNHTCFVSHPAGVAWAQATRPEKRQPGWLPNVGSSWKGRAKCRRRRCGSKPSKLRDKPL